MTADAFDEAFDRLFAAEGGYVNDPNDPGGETRYGISKRSYPGVDIKNLTIDGAKAIYRADYWAELDIFPDVLRFQLFDFAVNSGVETAIRHLQKALHVADDGHWGPVSIAALAAAGEDNAVLALNAAAWSNDGRGWARRIAQNLRYASDVTP